MPKNVVLCLDGTNNKVRAASNTNVVRMFEMLDLSDPGAQVAYYQPGVGTFSSAAAWTPPARALSRWSGLAFGAGLRQNLQDAYRYLMDVHEEGDRVFVLGFSRGAYTARALTGLLEVSGILRSGAGNLVPYVVGEYARQQEQQRFEVLREYARIYARHTGGRKDHVPVHFLGVWDTVKAAGTLWRQLRWPYTRQLPHVTTVRHAVSIDEWRRPYEEYLVEATAPGHLIHEAQDLEEVWFAGVHSDVGGTFPDGAHLSDIPLKWMAGHAVAAGLLVRPAPYRKARGVTAAEATGTVHPTGAAWRLLGTRRRRLPPGARVHSSVQVRVAADPAYGRRLPAGCTFVDPDWQSP